MLDTPSTGQPLAARMRRQRLAEFVGQDHLLGVGKPLRRAIEADRLHSMVFWGPPGTGKTTLARLLANTSGARFLTLSAVLSGVKDIRAAVDQAKHIRQKERRSTLLFVDEVHRFNKSQQDAFLPLRNAPNSLLKALGYGKGYRYDHDQDGAYAAGQRYFPDKMPNRCYYQPVDQGLEIKIREKLERLRSKS